MWDQTDRPTAVRVAGRVRRRETCSLLAPTADIRRILHNANIQSLHQPPLISAHGIILAYMCEGPLFICSMSKYYRSG